MKLAVTRHDQASSKATCLLIFTLSDSYKLTDAGLTCVAFIALLSVSALKIKATFPVVVYPYVRGRVIV